jgi:O-antigen/teichoic acid export membrane protein
LLASFFGPVPAGFYTLGRTVLVLPTTIVAQSVSDVFYPRISEASNAGENLSRLIRKATLGLAFIGFVPFAVIAATGPSLFGFVFGDEWRTAGLYASWLSLMLFFNFINRPCVTAVPVLGIQRGLVVYEVFSTAAKLLALYLGFVVFDSDVKAIALFSTFGAFAYIVLITWIYLTARDRDRRSKDVPKTSR